MTHEQARQILREAVARGGVLWHQHALERLLERAISRTEVLETLVDGEIVELYPDRQPFPGCLILRTGAQPLHVVATFDAESASCHVVTVYRPDLLHFEADYRTRRERP